MKIEYHPAIEPELEGIIAHYNQCAAGLGDEFLREFDRHIQAVAARPYHWVVVQGDIRRSLMRRFPYVIYFRLVHEEILRITVVKHQRRHPRRGLQRK
jgi:plasmid stabilization system protein ParE